MVSVNPDNYQASTVTNNSRMTDYYDIKIWNKKPEKFYNNFLDRDKSKIQTEMVSPLNVDTVKLYALLKTFISPTPNGFYTFVQKGLPLDNMIWWDFILESDKGFIQIWRTTSIIEAMYYFEDGVFDLNKFLHTNISKYITDVQNTISSFDKHSVYINHYRSYKECVTYLWKEILTLDLNPPVSPETHVVEDKIFNSYKDNIEQFMKTSVKFHTLGKSLVLNAAFEIESFLNLVIRVGASRHLKEFPDVLHKYLNSTFSDKLKNLKFYSVILNGAVDLENQAIKDANALMTLRNKYVHFDESSVHNKLGDVFFDGDFPLHPTSKDSPAVEAFKQVFHRPDFKTVKTAYDTSIAFVDYMQSLFIKEYSKSVPFLLETNPLGYNETKKVYSAIYNQVIVDFYCPKPETKDSKED